MKVLVNNKEVKTGATTLSQLIEELALPMQGIAVVSRQPYCTSHGMDKMHPEGIHAHHHYQSSLRRVRKMKDERLKNGGMQFITHYTERYSYLDAARMALEGGCRWVQLRMKDTPVETIEPVALEVHTLPAIRCHLHH